MRWYLCVIASLALLAPATTAQLLWGDNFDNQGVIGSPPGPYLSGAVGTFGNSSGGINSPTNGAWDAWYLNAAADGGISNTVFRSAPQSLEIGGVGGGGCDMVQWHQQATTVPGNPGLYDHATFGINAWPQSGTWQYRAWNYCPSSFPTGTSSHYFIVNDLLNNTTAGPTQWIMQVQFNHVTMTVKDDQRAGTAAPIVYDQWVELVATFDLDNACASVTYNGINIGNGVLFVPGWNVGTGPPQIANLDLFTQGATSYWDDITLTRLAPGPQYQVNNANAAGMTGISADINGVQGTSCGVATTFVMTGALVSINVNIPFTSPGFEGVVSFGPALPAGGGAIVAGPGQILNVPLPGFGGPPGFFLFGGNVPLFLPYAGGLNTVVSFTAPPGPIIATIQFATLDAFSPLNFSLSQPSTLIIP